MTGAPEDPSFDRWFAAAYEELRRLASAIHRHDPAATLGPTALVHEAYVRLAPLHGIAPQSRSHFLATAARAMRRVLIDAARRRQARKRGGNPPLVTLGDDAALEATPEAILALEDALEDLERHDPRAARVVHCRFFAGLEVAETAELLGLSASTVHREWQFARAWLADRLRAPG